MKKIFAILGTAVLAAAVLTGCSNAAGGSKDTPTASTNNGTNPTQEQQELQAKLGAVFTASNGASNSLGMAAVKAEHGGLQQEDINSAKASVSAIKPKVEDLKIKATEYLNKKGKTTEAAKVETVCTDYITALGEVETSLMEADTSTNKNKVIEANTKFVKAYQKFGQEAQKLQALFQ